MIRHITLTYDCAVNSVSETRLTPIPPPPNELITYKRKTVHYINKLFWMHFVFVAFQWVRPTIMPGLIKSMIVTNLSGHVAFSGMSLQPLAVDCNVSQIRTGLDAESFNFRYRFGPLRKANVAAINTQDSHGRTAKRSVLNTTSDRITFVFIRLRRTYTGMKSCANM